MKLIKNHEWNIIIKDKMNKKNKTGEKLVKLKKHKINQGVIF